MQYKQTLARQSCRCKQLSGSLSFLCLLLSMAGFSQTTYLQQGAKENILLERMEIRLATDSVLNFSKLKPLSRQQMIPRMQTTGLTDFSRVEAYNLYTAQLSNMEYVAADSMQSRRNFPGPFYKTPANFYEVNTKDFVLTLNPVFQYTVGKERNSSEHLFLNTRGISFRGRIAEKIGFAGYFTDNQERVPEYVRQWVSEREAVPGEGYFKEFKGNGYDYFDARGYFTFNAARYIDVSFGYDKNFIGNGYRSLFLSDFSNNVLFLKLNTRIWKFNYTNLFMELVNADRRGSDKLFGKKYAALHHLDLAVTKWLNLGVFEAVIFGRKDHFEFGYLNPVIFYRSVERQQGSEDNALLGFDAKANIAGQFQLYGQFLLDDLNFAELNKGWWGNKFGYQFGGKYIDAFGVSNLDLQLELNRVRPFTYSHDDSIANYTHNNQPLAHPLGANFNELVGVLRFQPAPKWMLTAKAIYYMQGRDTGKVNFGGNILLPNEVPYRRGDYGYEIGSGIPSKVTYSSLLLSYELKPNLFLEANAIMRKQSENIITAGKNTFIFNAGLRWNMHRREFDF